MLSSKSLPRKFQVQIRSSNAWLFPKKKPLKCSKKILLSWQLSMVRLRKVKMSPVTKMVSSLICALAPISQPPNLSKVSRSWRILQLTGLVRPPMTTFRESMVFLSHLRKSLTSMWNSLKKRKKEIIACSELNKTYSITLHFPQVQVSGTLKVLTSITSSRIWSENNIESVASKKLLRQTCTTLSFGSNLAIGKTTKTTCSFSNLRMQALD